MPHSVSLHSRNEALIVLAAAFLCLPAALAQSPGVTSDSVRIGSCSALSGPTSFLGTEMVAGAKAYFNLVNAQGGVNGRKLALETKDDEYDPERAAPCWESLQRAGMFAAAFFVGTPTAVKYVPLAESSQTPLVGLFTGAQALIEPVHHTIFNVRASYFDETREQVDGLWGIGVRRIAVLYQNDPFGTTVLEGVKRALEQHHSAPVSLGTFQRNTIAVEGGLKAVRAANPEAVVIVAPYLPVNVILRQAHGAGWYPRFLTVSFVGTEGLLRIGAQAADGMIITQVVPPYDRTDLPTVKLYREALDKNKEHAAPSFVSLEGFVDAMVLVDALRNAGRDLTREKFISALENIRQKDIGLGPDLTLSFSPKNHKGLHSVYVTVIRDGQPMVVTDWKELTNEEAKIRSSLMIPPSK